MSEADLAGKLNSFIPNVDQSTRKNFAASDLMIGTGTLSGTELKVTLQHYMSLVVLCPQGNKYIAGDYEYHSLYTSITSLQAGDVTAGYEPGDGNAPLHPSSVSIYRYSNILHHSRKQNSVLYPYNDPDKKGNTAKSTSPQDPV